MLVIQRDFSKTFQQEIYSPKLITENDSGRFYTLPEPFSFAVPSVTTFLGRFKDQGLQAWRQRIGEEKANAITHEAAARGEALHELLERYLRSQPIKAMALDPYSLRMFRAMRPDLDKIDNISLLESFLFSPTLRLAGRVDCVAEFDGILSVVDFKSSTRPKKEEWIENYFLQATCYATMYEELYKTPIEQIVVLIGVVSDGSAQRYVKKTRDYIDKLVRLRMENPC